MQRHHLNELNQPLDCKINFNFIWNNSSIHRYEKNSCYNLTCLIAESEGLDEGQVLLESGADGGLHLLFSFCRINNYKVLIPNPSYSGYLKMLERTQSTYEQYPAFNLEWATDVSTKSNTKKTALIFCHPDNPTGAISKEIATKLSNFKGLLIVDEAYFEFCPQSSLKALVTDPNKNVVIVRTFSKAFGAAGLRVGYLLANQRLIKSLKNYQLPYPVSSFSAECAIKLWQNRMFAFQNAQSLKQSCQKLSIQFKKLGFNCSKSETHFFCLYNDGPIPLPKLHKYLFETGVLTTLIIKGKNPLLRITTGDAQQNLSLLSKVRIFIEKNENS